MEPPPRLIRRLRKMLRYCDLSSGAFDITQEPDGTPYFLEVDPNGQYLWIELQTGAPITAAVVVELERIAVHGHDKVPTYGQQEVPTPRPILTTR